jgi:hypothetical protein
MCKGGYCLVTQQAYYSDLGVGISKIWEIMVFFLKGRPWDHFVWSWPTYHHLLLDTRNKNMVYGWGSQKFWRYYEPSCLRGNGTTMHRHHLHTISCYLTQETKIYMGWGFQRFSRYLITCYIKRDRTIPYGHDLHTIRCYLTQETRINMV